MKKILALVLAFIISLQLIAPAYAANGISNPKTEKTSGNFKYSLTDEEDLGVTITGYVNEPEGKLVIPTEIEGIPVGGIGKAAFRGCSKITSVFAPSIILVNESAFRECANLKSIYIPYVHGIQKNAFRDCPKLEKAEIYLVKRVDSYTFWGCSSLKEIEFYQVESLGNKAFYDCSSLETVIFFGRPLTSYGTKMFSNCSENLVIYYFRDLGWVINNYYIEHYGVDSFVCLDPEKGDINLDGSINTADAVYVLQYCAEMIWLADVQLMLVREVSGNNTLSTSAAVRLLKYCAGMIQEL